MGDAKKPEDYDPTGLGHLAKILNEIAKGGDRHGHAAAPHAKGQDIDRGTAGLGLDVSQEGCHHRDRSYRKGSHREHNATSRQPDREELQRGAAYRYRSRQLDLRLGSSGRGDPTGQQAHQLRAGSARHLDRIRESLGKLDADTDKIVSIKVYLTDLAPYAEFSKVRGEVFPRNPPTSSAVQVAGLLLGARIEIDAVAFVAKG